MSGPRRHTMPRPAPGRAHLLEEKLREVGAVLAGDALRMIVGDGVGRGQRGRDFADRAPNHPNFRAQPQAAPAAALPAALGRSARPMAAARSRGPVTAPPFRGRRWRGGGRKHRLTVMSAFFPLEGIFERSGTRASGNVVGTVPEPASAMLRAGRGGAGCARGFSWPADSTRQRRLRAELSAPRACESVDEDVEVGSLVLAKRGRLTAGVGAGGRALGPKPSAPAREQARRASA